MMELEQFPRFDPFQIDSSHRGVISPFKFPPPTLSRYTIHTPDHSAPLPKLTLSSRETSTAPIAKSPVTAQQRGQPHSSTVAPHSPRDTGSAEPRERAVAQTRIRWGPAPPRPTPTARSRRGGCFFVAVVISFIIIEYSLYMTCVLPDAVFYSDEDFEENEKFLDRLRPLGLAYTVVWQILFLMLVTSFIQTTKTDPGGVPPNWGFYMGDETKRRRYCKVCNIWKPDRSHHCSACGRCVLNMDHHCPWVKNCVGFYNRKFFIQLLVYTLICSSCVIVHGCYYIYKNGPGVMDAPLSKTLRYGGTVILVLCAGCLTLPLFPFTRYHFSLVARNSTTIEDLDVNLRYGGRYDIGCVRNFEQVCGSNICLWWLPHHTSGSRPTGDGVRWRQNYIRAIQDDE